MEKITCKTISKKCWKCIFCEQIFKINNEGDNEFDHHICKKYGYSDSQN